MTYTDYHKAITEENLKLAKISNSIFLGQQIEAPSYFYSTLKGIDDKQIREMPVAEEMQMGMSLGLALEGYLPISIFQRMDFLLRAADQLVNHLDKTYSMSRGIFRPKVIIRTTIGSIEPLHPGPQHCQDLCHAFKTMINIPVIRMTTVEEVRKAYNKARKTKDSILLVEEQSLYYNND